MQAVKVFLAMMILVAVATGYCLPDTSETAKVELAPPDIANKTTSELVELLKDTRMNYRSSALQELGKRKEKSALADIRALLADHIPFVQVDAAKALLDMGDFSGIQTLRDVMASPSSTPGTALKAAGILASHGDLSGETLAKSKLGSKYFTRRMDALDVLKNSADPEVAYIALQIGIEDEDLLVRRVAASALAEKGTLRSLEMLRTLLSSPDYDSRSAAVVAISKSRLWNGIPLLITALSDPCEVVRDRAAWELENLTGEKKNRNVRTQDRAAKLQNEWQLWWETNKKDCPTGKKSSVPWPGR